MLCIAQAATAHLRCQAQVCMQDADFLPLVLPCEQQRLAAGRTALLSSSQENVQPVQMLGSAMRPPALSGWKRACEALTLIHNPT